MFDARRNTNSQKDRGGLSASAGRVLPPTESQGGDNVYTFGSKGNPCLEVDLQKIQNSDNRERFRALLKTMDVNGDRAVNAADSDALDKQVKQGKPGAMQKYVSWMSLVPQVYRMLAGGKIDVNLDAVPPVPGEVKEQNLKGKLSLEKGELANAASESTKGKMGRAGACFDADLRDNRNPS